jgi:hypothetical protein
VAASRRIVLCRYHLWRRGIDDFGLLSAVDRRRCLEPKWKASFEMAQAKAEVAGDNRPMLARLGYWRELEIAAAQSAAGRRVLDRLVRATTKSPNGGAAFRVYLLLRPGKGSQRRQEDPPTVAFEVWTGAQTWKATCTLKRVRRLCVLSDID